jgi:hypothetical protein
MLTDARIRLEGKLEEVERAAAVLELALPPAKMGSWVPVKIALDTVGVPRVWRAVRAARELAKTETELQTVLGRLDGVRIKLADAVHAAARQRAIPTATVRQELNQLAADAVLYEAQLRNSWGLAAVPFLFVYGVILFGALHARAAVLPVIGMALFMSIGLVPFLFSTRVLVTRQTLIIGKRAVRTADVQHVVIRSTGRRTATPYDIRVELAQGALEDQLPDAPLELDAALRKLGIETERIGNVWF